MSVPFRIGERIYLSPVELDDIDHYLRWLNDPDVTHFLNFRLPLSREMEQTHLERLVRDHKSVILGIRLKESDKLIGNTGFHGIDHLNRRATFGIVIGEKEHWSKGFGTEATEMMVEFGFNTLNLNRIELEVFDFNARGIRCYERVGFTHEGIKRQAVYRNGQYFDCIQMGLLRNEWVQRSKSHEQITVV